MIKITIKRRVRRRSTIGLGELAIHQAPDAACVFILQLNRQGGIGKTLKTDWARKPFDRGGADGSKMNVAGSGIRSSVMHRGADFDAGGKAVENKAPRFL